jgi:GxxExxY protein
MDTGEDRVNFLSKRIIGCALTVLHTLGTGFLEKVHQNALVHERSKRVISIALPMP